jgi:hypothetical protein
MEKLVTHFVCVDCGETFPAEHKPFETLNGDLLCSVCWAKRNDWEIKPDHTCEKCFFFFEAASACAYHKNRLTTVPQPGISGWKCQHFRPIPHVCGDCARFNVGDYCDIGKRVAQYAEAACPDFLPNPTKPQNVEEAETVIDYVAGQRDEARSRADALEKENRELRAKIKAIENAIEEARREMGLTK